MKIIVDDTGIPNHSLFGLIWLGYVIGVAAISIIGAIIILPIMLLGWLFRSSDAVVTTTWHPVDAWGAINLVLLPIHLAWQGVVVGMIVVFGLWIYRKFRTVEVQRAEE